MSIHSHIRQNFQTVPFQGRGLTGICFEPFQSLPLDEIPWDTLADEPNPTYRLEKSSRTRCVVSFEWDASRLGAGAPPTLRLYAKRVLSKSLRRAFTSLVHQSKARKELELGLKMFDAGIATALPVVYAERRRLGFLRECFLATVGLEPSQPFYISFLNLESAEARLKALAELALFIRKGHEGGFYHDDCSTEHVFVEGPPYAPSAHKKMSFIDVDNGRLNSVPGEWNRVKNCFQIFRSLPEDCLTRDEKACFLKVYFNRELSEGEIDDYLARVGMWKSWKRQRKRLLKALRLKKAKIKR